LVVVGGGCINLKLWIKRRSVMFQPFSSISFYECRGLRRIILFSIPNAVKGIFLVTALTNANEKENQENDERENTNTTNSKEEKIKAVLNICVR
jgi:hypothetical protein